MIINLTSKQLDTVNRILEFRDNMSAEQIVDEALDYFLNEQKLEHLRAIMNESVAQEERNEYQRMTSELSRRVRENAMARYRQGDVPDPDVIP